MRLGEPDLWQGKAGKYEIEWCDLCQTFQISCLNPDCRGTSCNGGGCDDCVPDHIEFNKLKIHPSQYFNEAEKKVLEKERLLRKYMPESLAKSEYEIDFDRIQQAGKLSQYAEEIFESEIILSKVQNGTL